jgi:cyclic pyranopterin phosphate synthase
MTERPRPDEGHSAGGAADADDVHDADDVYDESDTADGIDTTDTAEATSAAGTDELTHTTDAGNVDMVDVGAKPDTARRAVARGEIALEPSTIDAIREDEIGKGNVLATARIGAIQAVKHTWETIPMCHAIPISNVETDFAVGDGSIELTVAVETTGKTGCEMEALEGVTTGLNTIWDMVKAVEKNEEGQYPATRIEDIRVLEKQKRSL